MKNFIHVLLLFVFVQLTEAQQKPNIVFILTDDQGYGDASYLNEHSKIPTPNIDRLASQGVIFTDAHSSSSVCTPTRYGILTGRYNWRSTLKKGVLGGYSGALIKPDRKTLPRMLQEEGYQTACIGKWHLGWTWGDIDKGADHVDFAKPVTDGPVTRGFDYFYGIPASLDMVPYVYVENDHVTAVPDHESKGVNRSIEDPEYEGKFWRKGPTGSDFVHQEVLPNFVDHATRYIREKAAGESPYFLYLPLPAPHAPILPSEEFRGKSGVSPYADFVMMVDAEIGKVLQAIEDSGESENTIVVFASDNGPAPAADLETLQEKGHNSSYIFRGYKADLFDGGHRIPCIVRWPGKFEPKKVGTTICLTDFMATFAGITGYDLADNEGEDSFDLMPLLLDHSRENYRREATVHHSINGDFTIRQGKWKLLLAPGSGGWSYPRPGKDDEVLATLPPYQLYDMQKDPGERHNLYNKRPKIVRRMKGILEGYISNGRSTPGTPQSNDGEKIVLREE